MDDDYEKRYRCPECDTSFSDYVFEERCDLCSGWMDSDEISFLHGKQVCDSCLGHGVDAEKLREQRKDKLNMGE